MKIHPFADDWPMMDRQRLDELAADIKANGLHVALTKLGDELLDGRNREFACELAGVKPTFRDYVGPTDDESLLRFLESVNGQRRHLTPSQRAVVAFKRKKRLEAANLRTTNFSVAKQLGVSERTVEAVGEIAEKSPKSVLKDLEDGHFAVCDVKANIDLSKRKQSKLAEKAKRAGTTLKKARISGGTAFDPKELDGAPAKHSRKSGSPIVPGKDRALATKYLSELSRIFRRLDIFDEFNTSLSQMISRVKALK